MRAIAVVGSCWGDEGKGAAVDKLVSANPDTLVIRHNGGSQAGHTVVTPDGKRHVFSHFCSGALAGAPSYLSEYFVVNPHTFLKEREELEKIDDANLWISANEKALVTTPLDVAINRALELTRGRNKHGSVGVGFGETIERSERGFAFYAEDLEQPKEKIRRLLDEWMPFRLNELNLTVANIDWKEFEAECLAFADFANVLPLEEAAKGHSTIIFEGAQGLLLDQKRGVTFPHVTRSNTGIQNVLPLLDQLNLKELEVIYMMRPYLTRHGAGPLPGEVKELTGIHVTDETNRDGPWQGVLRLAPMKLDLVRDAIVTDLKQASEKSTISIKPSIGISCVDQVRGSDIFNVLHLKYPIALTGHGPRRDQYKLKGDH